MGSKRGAAVKDEPQHKHRQGGEEEVPVFQQTKIHDGIFAREFPDQGRDQSEHRQRGAGNDEVRFKPVLALSLIQNHLQESQAHTQQAQPNEIDADSRLKPLAHEERRVKNQEEGENQGDALPPEC